VVLLDVHVVDERCLRHSEVTALKAQGRETKPSVNGCQITSQSMRLLIWPTKSRYDLLVCSVQESYKQENKLAR
jgi:hypothetical protein